jgi:hypothetical protein
MTVYTYSNVSSIKVIRSHPYIIYSIKEGEPKQYSEQYSEQKTQAMFLTFGIPSAITVDHFIFIRTGFVM